MFKGSKNKRRKAAPLVHTTNLANHTVKINGARVANSTRFVSAPAVLVPRIGKPAVGKIALYSAATPIVISDCVFGLECNSLATARAVRSTLTKNWAQF